MRAPRWRSVSLWWSIIGLLRLLLEAHRPMRADDEGVFFTRRQNLWEQINARSLKSVKGYTWLRGPLPPRPVWWVIARALSNECATFFITHQSVRPQQPVNGFYYGFMNGIQTAGYWAFPATQNRQEVPIYRNVIKC